MATNNVSSLGRREQNIFVLLIDDEKVVSCNYEKYLG
jgi:hypothetical protein